MQELETISKMVLDKQGERPMLIIAWGKFLKMFYECYPESRLTMHALDECPRGSKHEWGYAISPDTLEICLKCGTRK